MRCGSSPSHLPLGPSRAVMAMRVQPAPARCLCCPKQLQRQMGGAAPTPATPAVLTALPPRAMRMFGPPPFGNRWVVSVPVTSWFCWQVVKTWPLGAPCPPVSPLDPVPSEGSRGLLSPERQQSPTRYQVARYRAKLCPGTWVMVCWHQRAQSRQVSGAPPISQWENLWQWTGLLASCCPESAKSWSQPRWTVAGGSEMLSMPLK